jgi:putative transposase
MVIVATPLTQFRTWLYGIFIPERSEAVSSTVSAWVVDKPLKSHLETTMKQEVNYQNG